MADFNLIPESYLRAQILRRRMKWFGIAVAALVCLVALARLLVGWGIQTESRAAQRLETESRTLVQAKSSADDYRQQIQTVERKLKALEDLRGRNRLPRLFNALDAAYQSGVWFDAIRYYRSEVGVAGNSEGAPGAAAAASTNAVAPGAPGQSRGFEQRVELSGHALSHLLVAEYIRALGRQPGVTDVRLLSTNLRTSANAQMVDFRVSLLCDEQPVRQP